MKYKLSVIPAVSHVFKEYLIYWLVFFIPVNKMISSYIIIAIFLFWLMEGKFKERFKLVVDDKKRVFLFSLSALYFLYLIGLIFTKNFSYAGFDLQVKLSLFIFPLIFSTTDFKYYKNENIFIVLSYFITGVVLNTLICIISAAYQYFFKDHDSGHFLYARFSGTMGFHPTYIAMYINFAIMAMLTMLFNDIHYTATKYKNRFKIYIVFLSIIIILLSSKAGIISMLITYLIFIIYLIIKQKRLKLGISILASIIVLCVGIFTLVPSSLNRLKVAFTVVSQNSNDIKETGESTSDRILIWKASTDIIKDNFITGVGTGDVKDVLMDKYKEKNLWFTYDHKLNAHNQFIQTFISIGVLGFLTLLASIIIPMIYAIKRNNMIYVFFLLIFFINILVESMLENQAGVVFYAFFSSFLLMVSYKKTITD